MKLTFFGLGGTGTSSVCKEISKRLNIDYFYAGHFFRLMAKEKNLTIEELDAISKENTSIDYEVDGMMEKYGRENDNFVLEGRWAWHFVPDSIKIKLICDEEEAARRVFERQGGSINDSLEMTRKREKDIQERYNKSYPNVSYPPEDSVFDKIIDSTNVSVDEIVEDVLKFISNK